MWGTRRVPEQRSSAEGVTESAEGRFLGVLWRGSTNRCQPSILLYRSSQSWCFTAWVLVAGSARHQEPGRLRTWPQFRRTHKVPGRGAWTVCRARGRLRVGGGAHTHNSTFSHLIVVRVRRRRRERSRGRWESGRVFHWGRRGRVICRNTHTHTHRKGQKCLLNTSFS